MFPQTEWTYNYHDSEAAYRCNASYYPTPEEQHRFVRAYLLHTPMFKAPIGAASNPPTPYLGPLHTSGSTTALAATAAPSSINAFMLDARAPPGESYSYQEQEAQAEQEAEEETKRLMAETRLWRLANSAHWTAWGIVQANIPGLPVDEDDKGEGERANEQAKELDSATLEMRVEADAQGKAQEGVTSGGIDGADVSHNEEEQHQDEDEEFDYLAYAHERALFFWGDAIALGIIRAEELPEEIRKRVKIVEY
jgi:choline kinase